MTKKTKKTVIASSQTLNERYQRMAVSYLEKGQLSLKEAKEKFHVKNEAVLIQWIRKYGIFDPDYIVVHQMSTLKEPTQVKRLKEQIKAKDTEIEHLRKENHLNKQKGIMFDAIVEVVKEDYDIDLSKKVMPGQLTNTSPLEEKV